MSAVFEIIGAVVDIFNSDNNLCVNVKDVSSRNTGNLMVLYFKSN